MRIRHTYLTAMLAAACAALASTLAAAPPAAADCVSAGGTTHPLTLCSDGDVRVSNRTPLVAATPIALMTVMWTGRAARASASLSVTDGGGGGARVTDVRDLRQAAMSSPPSAVQVHHVAGVDARRRNRFGQWVLHSLFGDEVGVGRQRQDSCYVPATSSPA